MDFKKQKMDNGARVTSMAAENENDLRHKVPPSPVVHIRGLRDYVSEDEIRDSLKTFGNINFVMNIPKKQMALVEFQDIQSATNLVEFSAIKNLFINGKRAMFNYSTSQSIKRPNDADHAPSAVLMLLISNVQHPITVDVLHAACNPIGPVVRIVVFRRFGVQAMVEFDSIATASRARLILDGADIYQNCCTIKAEFGKPAKLTVVKNDLDTWDFTVMSAAADPLKSRPLLAEPRYGTGPSPFGGASNDQFGNSRSRMDPAMNSMVGMGGVGNEGFSMGRGRAFDPMPPGAMAMQGGSMETPGCVVMVYGLVPEKMNCQKLFNLFCLYGNVLKVKFLKSKEGWAMVQMAEKDGCHKVIQNLNNCTLYDSQINVSFSKQPYLQDVQMPYNLPDGSLSFRDFSKSRNNRFSTPAAAAKNRICGPTESLYFFNAPPELDERAVCDIFREAGEPTPDKVIILKAVSEKSSRGVACFEDVHAATNALAGTNNTKLNHANSDKPYVVKLAFSSRPSGTD